jgi:hypothetical protein
MVDDLGRALLEVVLVEPLDGLGRTFVQPLASGRCHRA